MNILIISTPSPYKTSGVVAYNLYKGLKNKGHNTKLLIKLYDIYREDDIICMESAYDVFLQRVNNKIKKITSYLPVFKKAKVKSDPDYYVQDYDQTISYYSTTRLLKKVKFKPDAIFYLFQQNFLSAKNLYELNKLTGAAIFWYIMDTAPLTGVCHYSWHCTRYKVGCGKCPALFSTNEDDQSAANFRYKYKYLSKTNISIIVGTEWQKRKVVESMLFKQKPVHKVILSIDPDVFNYLPKARGKSNYGIPQHKKVIFFGSTSLSDKRKGMKFLGEALKAFKESYAGNDDILLLVAGRNDNFQEISYFENKFLGFLENSEQLACAFQAADVFVCPSVEDAGPMMINQSIMCGTPVVSFDMGVAEDLVITGITGYRARLYDSNDLARGINDVLSLNNEDHGHMCLQCRNLGLNGFTLDASTEKIIKIVSANLH